MTISMESVIEEMEESGRIKDLMATLLAREITYAGYVIANCYQNGGRMLVFGNGGSAADAQHLAGEMVGHFSMERDPLPALALSTDTSVLTAIANDYSYEDVFARQIRALGRPGDVAVAISTSGNSPNVLGAIEAARQQRMKAIGLTGKSGGQLAHLVDVALVVPSDNTQRIQEAHIMIIHVLCRLVEESLFSRPLQRAA